MFAAILPYISTAATWLGRIGLAVFAVNEVKKLTQGQKDQISEGAKQAGAAGITEDEQKQLIAATTYEQIEKEGKSPEDFWQGLSPQEQEALKFSPRSLQTSMQRTSFLGLSQTILWIGAGVAAGVAGFRGIPILLSTLSKTAAARAAGATALQLMTIMEEGKIAGIAKVWIPSWIAGIAAAGGWLTGGLANNMNDALLWGRVFLDQSHSDIEKAARNAGQGSGGTGGGFTSGQGPRTIIRMVEEKKPMQFLGTLFSAKLGKLEHFDRKLDDEITDMDDLETDVKLNVNKWLQTLPGRMGYSIIIRKDPVDETGVQQSGIWATATLHVLQLSGKILPIDTILLGPVSPAVRLELARSTKTIETQIDGIVKAQEIRELQMPNGIVDIFTPSGERVSLDGTSTPVKSEVAPATPAPATPAKPKVDTASYPRDQAGAYAIHFWKLFGISDERWNSSEFDQASKNANFDTYIHYLKQGLPFVNAIKETTSSTKAGSQNKATIRRGDTGDQVKSWQIALNTFGENLKVDGDFGALTEAATKRFQQRARLTADGVVGPQTYAALVSGTVPSI